MPIMCMGAGDEKIIATLPARVAVVDPQLQETIDNLPPAADEPVPPPPEEGSSALAMALSAASFASTAALAYHGYKRNDSWGWALAWGLVGGLFWPLAVPVAFAQGFGKRAGK